MPLAANDTCRLSDESLLAASAGGDETAFEELVRRYQGRMIGLACRYTGDHAAGEDLAAEIFLKIWKNAARFKGEASFSTWSYRIAVNTCLNYKRGGAGSGTVSLDEDIESEDGPVKRELPEPARYQPDQALQDAERAAAVRQALDRLPPQQKTAFVLCWFEERSYREIAEAMQVSVGAVESLLFRAKERLKKFLTAGK